MPRSSSDLSHFYQILVYLENNGETPFEKLRELGPIRQIVGAVGRLEGLHYISRVKKADELTYQLEEKGDEALARVLDFLPEEKTWDGKWRIVIVRFPEKQRSERHLYRSFLQDLGARMLHTSVWITPSETVTHYLAQMRPSKANQDKIITFSGDIDLDTVPIEKLWNTKQLEKDYHKLFADFDKNITDIKKMGNKSFNAKCYLLRLAFLTRQDPYLTLGLNKSTWIGHKAVTWYKKIRPLCT